MGLCIRNEICIIHVTARQAANKKGLIPEEKRKRT